MSGLNRMGTRTTDNLRAPEDLCEMVRWLAKIEGVTTSKILDPILRPIVTARFAAAISLVKSLKQSEDAAAIAAGREPGPPLPTVVLADPETTRPKKKEK
jgi:hypothetical protein